MNLFHAAKLVIFINMLPFIVLKNQKLNMEFHWCYEKNKQLISKN